MNEEGDIRIFNPSKEISREIILEVLTRHRDVMKQARTGEILYDSKKIFGDNERRFNQVRALSLIISAQREMITISRPNIKFRSMQKWKNAHKNKEDEEKLPFEEHDNDYNRLIEWLEFLKACEKDILIAERTKSIDDDFIIETFSSDGEKILRLTDNFYDMLGELENSYESIYLLMLTNKIVSAGIEENEELTDKEKEEEMIRRVVEA